MYRKSIYIGIIFVILSLAACGKKDHESENNEVNFLSPETVQEKAQSHITAENTSEGKNLYIDADVELGDLKELAETKILIDEETVQKFVDHLVRKQYPEVSEGKENSGERVWDYFENGQLIIACSLSENGFLNYLNVPEDLNCPYMDGEHIFEYGYMTDVMPPQMNLPAEEAAEQSGQFLNEYSCFSFRPWNILAGDQPDADAASGCYYISMQAIYDGIPVSVKSEANAAGLSTTVVFSKNGIFQVQGSFLFQDYEKRKIEQIADFDSILKKFQLDFSTFSEGDTITVDRVSIEYFPEPSKENSYTLVPVWVFDCTDRRTEINQGEEEDIYLKYSYMYSAEDGSFYGIYY